MAIETVGSSNHVAAAVHLYRALKLYTQRGGAKDAKKGKKVAVKVLTDSYSECRPIPVRIQFSIFFAPFAFFAPLR
jgi:hypothetical protein